jgi:hypothetical protein
VKDRTTAESIGAVEEIVLAASVVPIFSTPVMASIDVRSLGVLRTPQDDKV